MTWPIPAILCRPSYVIVFYCIAFYCWTGQLRCKSSLSDIIIIIIMGDSHDLFTALHTSIQDQEQDFIYFLSLRHFETLVLRTVSLSYNF